MSFDDTKYSITISASSHDFNTTPFINNISDSISSTSSVTASLININLADSSISSTTDVTSALQLTALASSAVNATVSGIDNTNASIIFNISTGISIPVSTSVGITTLAIAYKAISANITARSKKLVSSIDFLKVGILEDTGDIKPFFMLDGIPISEHNRQTSISSEPKYIANNNWSGRKRVYFKTSSSKKIFNFQWTFLPGKRENTVDLHAGRNEIKAFAEDPTQLVLKIRNLDANATTPHTDATYNVLVVNYNETLVRRDLNNDEYYWDCSLSLREV